LKEHIEEHPVNSHHQGVSYAVQQNGIMFAVEGLATSSASIQRRLVNAHGGIVSVEAKDFGDTATRSEFESIMISLASMDRGKTRSVSDTVRDMPDIDAEKIAKLIYNFFITRLQMKIPEVAAAC
jgi:hypothetical protein